MKKLNDIEARANAATEGPWIEYHENGTPGVNEAFICPPATGAHLIDYTDDWDQKQRDANFMAHARDDVPRLTNALRAVLEIPRSGFGDAWTNGYNTALKVAAEAITDALQGEQ